MLVRRAFLGYRADEAIGKLVRMALAKVALRSFSGVLGAVRDRLFSAGFVPSKCSIRSSACLRFGTLKERSGLRRLP
jgi:hypothetical protein